MWDSHIVRNMARLLKTLSKTNLSIYGDEEEIRNYIGAILTVNQDIDGNYYPYRIHVEETPYKTFDGDNNHGWAVVFVDVEGEKLKVQSRFYDTDGKPKSNESLWGDAIDHCKYENWEEANIEKLKKMLDSKLFNNTEDDLQSIFNTQVEHYLKKLEEKNQEEGYVVRPILRVKEKDDHEAWSKTDEKLKELGFNVTGYNC
jgi:squalene cyclase